LGLAFSRHLHDAVTTLLLSLDIPFEEQRTFIEAFAMTLATKSVSNRIAVVFDFDDTLVPDTVDSLLESCGIDALQFRQERIQPHHPAIIAQAAATLADLNGR
jgi:hypothetical protein